MNNNEQPPLFNEAEFGAFVSAVWAGRDPDTRIFVGALPSNANKALADELTKAGQRLPPECRTHYRAFGPEDVESLLKFIRAENGRRNLSLKMGRYKKDASSASLSNVSHLHFAWLDIEARTEAERELAVDALYADGALAPHVVVNSGGGIHAYWLYTQPLKSADFDTGRKINEHLARVFAGDASVVHAAGAQRAPGTFNVNRNASCKVLFLNTADDVERYDPAKLLRWLDSQGPHLTMSANGIVPVPPESRAALRAHEREAEHARTHGKDWDDVVANLSVEGASNAYGGRNRALAMFAGKVYAMGGSVESAVALAQDKGCTLTAAEITTVCESVARTHERMNEKTVPRTREEAKAQKADAAPVEEPAPGEEPAAEASEQEPEPDEAPDTDVDPTSARARLTALLRKHNDKDDDFTFVLTSHLKEITDALVEWLTVRGVHVLYEIGDEGKGWWWVYTEGTPVWGMRAPEQIEAAAASFWFEIANSTPKGADRNEIVNALRLHVQQARDAVTWDNYQGRHLIVSGDGRVIDIVSGQELPASPDYHLTDRCRVAADYDPAAKSPVWDTAVRMMFDNTPDKDRIATMLEEWMGSALLGPSRPRETFKGLLISGESLGGKSSLGFATRAVIGDTRVIAADMETVAGPFGLSTFFESRASMWICDDPDASVRLPDGIIKKLITNETVTINTKRKSLRDARLGLTVGIFCNEMPKIEDTSNAVYNRMLMLRSGIIFTQTPDPSDPRQRKADPALADKFKAERSGILNRMIEGARRLIANGNFTIPAAVTLVREEVHELQAPARAFIKTCIVAMPAEENCVRRVQLRRAFIGFMESENPGWYRNARNIQWEMRRFYKALYSMFPASGEKRRTKIKGTPAEQTVQTHLNLTQEGIAYLAVGTAVEDGKMDQNFENDPAVKHANDLRYLGLDTKGKPILEAVKGGKAHMETATTGE